MKLESLPKYYSPKSQNFSATSPATGGEGMTITDVMAAQGFVQSEAPLGFRLFLAKANIDDPETAIKLLAEFAADNLMQCRAIQALDSTIRSSVLFVLATMAYQDYSRSAASVRPCDCCKGEGFIDAEVFTMRAVLVGGCEIERKEEREQVRLVCRECNGKKVISNACRCHGKGKVQDSEASKMQGMPVLKTCEKCAGRGYSRLKFSAVLAGLQSVWPALKKSRAYSDVLPFFETLVSQCHRAENDAELAFSNVTRD